MTWAWQAFGSQNTSVTFFLLQSFFKGQRGRAWGVSPESQGKCSASVRSIQQRKTENNRLRGSAGSTGWRSVYRFLVLTVFPITSHGLEFFGISIWEHC